MGEVYRAYDERLQRWVAIKNIRPTAAQSAKARERFRREARAVAQLNHPAIVQVFDILEADEGDWIVMELVEGTPLSTLVKKGPLAIELVLHLAREIVDGLAEAHAKGIVHRDLKSENVLITKRRHAKILDFGLAKQLWPEESLATLSRDGVLLGTCRAMSPEQARALEVDHRSDLFSLGILLYEMASGVSPFAANTAFDTLTNVVSHRQPSAYTLNPKVPDGVSRLIDHLLEKRPEDRPQSAEAVSDALGGLDTSDDETVIGIRLPRPASHSGQQRSHSDTSSQPTNSIVLKTLLHLDLVDGERLAETLSGPQVFDLLTRHDRLTRDLAAEHGGREIEKSEGFLFFFERPIDAVHFAIAYHRALATFSSEVDETLKGRIGIHLGEVFLRENAPLDINRGAKPLEVEGMAKTVAGQTMRLARAGQTLVTQGAFALARRGLTGGKETGIRSVCHGAYALEGLRETIELYEVGETARAPFARPPRAVGRRHRLALLGLGVCLLLAILVASGFLLRQRLASSGLETRPTVAVLGFKNLSGRPDDAWLSTALAELISTELASGGALRLIPGESVARMMLELALEETDTLADDTLQRIRRNLGTDFVVVGSYLVLEQGDKRLLRVLPILQDTQNGETIVTARETGLETELFEIVSEAGAALRQRLGVAGISAQQAEAFRATLSSSARATRLYSEGLVKLRGFEARAARDLLRVAVEEDPSYALAHAALSEAWSALGYDREAEASARRAYELSAGLPREAALSIEGRFHEAAGALSEAVDTYRVLWGYHPDNIEHGLQLAYAQITAGQSTAALDTIEDLRRLPSPVGDDPRIDLAEAQAAWSLADQTRQLAAAARAIEKGREQKTWLLVAKALFEQGRMYLSLGQLDDATTSLHEARALFADAGDRKGAAECLNQMALILKYQGKLSEAEALYREVLSIHRQIGDRRRVATMLNNLAVVTRIKGQLTVAATLLEEAIIIARETGDSSREAQALENLASVLLRHGTLAKAESTARQALDLAAGLELVSVEAWALFDLGEIHAAQGDLESARRRLAKALEICEETGYRHLAGFVHNTLGKVLMAMGDLEGAEAEIEKSRLIREELGESMNLEETRHSLAALQIERGRAAEAAALARRAAEAQRQGERLDDAAASTVVSVNALLATGDLEGVRERLAGLRLRAEESESPQLRLAIDLAAERLRLARGQPTAALDGLAMIENEARALGLKGLAFAAAQARGEAEIAAGRAKAGKARLEALAQEAETAGHGLIAQRAREAQ